MARKKNVSLNKKEFEAQLNELAASLRRSIEAEQVGFDPSSSLLRRTSSHLSHRVMSDGQVIRALNRLRFHSGFFRVRDSTES